MQPTALAEPAASIRGALASLIHLVLQLGLVLLVVYQYQIESRTFFTVLALAVAGFPIHAMLPAKHRMPFFVALSFAGIGLVFGLADGAWLIVLGAALIGVCHLPLRLATRVALLLLLGSSFAVFRAGWAPVPWSSAVWPILGSMFMFRLAVYLYALQHSRTAVEPAKTLAYFFMLPNVCFPLFPVVDYDAFGRNYYDARDLEIYDRGVRWIIRGVVHLLAYRFVYQNLTLDPAAVQSLGDIVQFMLTTFLLYLRVSGQFHIIVGMLHLFGFRLPETHHFYYLASSFTDFWRRINIYWKDFMMKLVYYPSFFRLRRWGDKWGMIGATLIVFFATWILHSYQWFWLRGGFPITAQDGVFWGLLAGLVVVNTVREQKRGRKRSLGQEQGWDAGRAVRTVLMFWGMTVLWSLWSSESVMEWLLMWGSATRIEAKGLMLIGGVTAGLLVAGGMRWGSKSGTASSRHGLPLTPSLLRAAGLVALAGVGHPAVYEYVRQPGLAAAMVSLRSDTLNDQDAALQHRGYYENLDNPSRLSTELWTTYSEKPADWVVLEATVAYRTRPDFLLGDLRPNQSITFQGQPFTTNRWGMRDREYSEAKPSGTHRIAVLGPSFVMGFGVADGEPFEAVLEDRLNADAGDARFEVLNFGVGNYSLLQQMALLDERVWRFQPDAVVVTMTDRTKLVNSVTDHLIDVTAQGIEIPYEGLERLVDEVAGDARANRVALEIRRPIWLLARKFGASREVFAFEAERRIRARTDEIVSWALRRIGDEARQRGVVPILLGLDIVGAQSGPEGLIEGAVQAVAEDAGFVVVDLFDVYNGHDRETLRVAPWDGHPNTFANRLVAERLHTELLRQGLARPTALLELQ